MNEEEKSEIIVESLKGHFLKEFAEKSGVISLFVLANQTADPKETLSMVLDFWAGTKDETLQEVIKRSMEVRDYPDEFSEIDQSLYGSIEPEDYQIQFQKAVLSMKKEVKKMFIEFNKNLENND